ncbi:hypothetical protein E2C01_013511 [Portunus trituberculatus]|uniref:Uncharacterized protein n=1 Tax=Portunus trituberculatus TaxID=210409 RepID=A0A5B7DGF8_PORTR|nr:hypothetical protein [Portunus trituberculatus]
MAQRRWVRSVEHRAVPSALQPPSMPRSASVQVVACGVPGRELGVGRGVAGGSDPSGAEGRGGAPRVGGVADGDGFFGAGGQHGRVRGRVGGGRQRGRRHGLECGRLLPEGAVGRLHLAVLGGRGGGGQRAGGGGRRAAVGRQELVVVGRGRYLVDGVGQGVVVTGVAGVIG